MAEMIGEELPDFYDSNERKIYEEEILKDKTGCGTIYTGEVYHLDYQPLRKDSRSLKCIGITLIIRKNLNPQYYNEFSIEIIKFESPYIGGILGFYTHPDPRIFQERLAEAINIQKNRIIEKENHLRAIKESAEKVVKCQIKLDQTVKEVAGITGSSQDSLAQIDMVAKEFKRIEEGRKQGYEIYGTKPQLPAMW